MWRAVNYNLATHGDILVNIWGKQQLIWGKNVRSQNSRRNLFYSWSGTLIFTFLIVEILLDLLLKYFNKIKSISVDALTVSSSMRPWINVFALSQKLYMAVISTPRSEKCP